MAKGERLAVKVASALLTERALVAVVHQRVALWAGRRVVHHYQTVYHAAAYVKAIVSQKGHEAGSRLIAGILTLPFLRNLKDVLDLLCRQLGPVAIVGKPVPNPKNSDGLDALWSGFLQTMPVER